MTRVADEGAVQGDDALQRAAEDVAEGRSVDWSSLGKRVQDPKAVEVLENLRIIGAVAGVHQAAEAAGQSVDRTVAFDGVHPPPEGAGEPWGRYRLLDMVGSGSFGSVYRAWDPQLERELAIKILHRHVADDELTARLLREGRALARMQHDNVVEVYGVESNEGRTGLCMEFVRGETLDASMADGHRLNSREAILVGQDVCRALAAVHAAGFVHRDITAKNIMRALRGRIVVMDFGTGLKTADGLSTGPVRIAGTPMYMAPEVLVGQPPSVSSDVYSIGVLLYYLVTGEFPVEGRTLTDLRTAHIVGRRTPLRERAPDLPPQFIHAVESALVANPQQRCQTAAALLDALDAVVARKRTRSQYLVLGLEILAGAALGVTVLGAINSRYFNHTLGRTDFANESVRDWLSFGVSATIAPTVILIFTLFALGLLSVIARLLVNMSATARSAKVTLARGARRCRLDQVSNLSACVLALSAGTLIVAWWYFVPFLGALGAIANGDISTVSGQDLAFLSPLHHPYHELYRKSFTAVVIVCLALWYPVVWLAARKQEPINRSILAGGVAVLVLSLLLLDFPYRLIVGRKRNFEMATWSSEACFILGERQAHLLLYCPDSQPPRNRIVRADDPNLRRLGIVQDIFANAHNLK